MAGAGTPGYQKNEKTIADLKAKAKMESNATKQDFEKELAVLEQKNQSLKEKNELLQR